MSAHHTSPLRPQGEDLLKAALSDPFSVPPDVPRVSPFQPATASGTHTPSDPAAPAPTASAGPGAGTGTGTIAPTPPEPSSSSSSVSVSAAEQEAWKAEYEANVVEWRRQSADVRARAEAERARWEERRAREREEQAALRRQGQGVPETSVGVGVSVSGESANTSEWEAVSAGTQQSASVPPPPSSSSSGAPSHLQESRTQQNLPQSAGSNAPPTRPAPSAGPQAATGDPSGSPQWENVLSSPTSSFPSMSFPEPSLPHSPEHSLHAPRATTTPTSPPTATASVTLAVFDPSLPARARIWALFSSLSINMFLPFVNGVMLGFGEIFAKTVIVGWLGWGPTVATNVGLGVRSGNRSQSRWW